MLLLLSSHGVLVRQGVQANCFQWNSALVDGNYIVTTMSRGEGDGKVSLTPFVLNQGSRQTGFFETGFIKLVRFINILTRSEPQHFQYHKRDSAKEPFLKRSIAVQIAGGGKPTDKKGNR
jgi:hypothetical protein